MDPCGAWSLRHRAATIKLQYSRPVPQRSPEQHESHCTARRPRMHSRRTLLGEIAWAAVSVRPHQSSPLYRLSRNSRDTLNQALPPISLHRFKGHPQLIVRRRESLGTRLPVTLSHINSLITLRMCFFSVCILTPPPPLQSSRELEVQGELLGRMVPRCTDPSLDTRLAAIDCVQIILRVSTCSPGQGPY